MAAPPAGRMVDSRMSCNSVLKAVPISGVLWRYGRAHRAAVKFLRLYGDAHQYLKENSDVGAMGQSAEDHWLRHGISEGRRFPGIKLIDQSVGIDWSSSRRVMVALGHQGRLALAPDERYREEQAFAKFIIRNGEAHAYLAANPDVEAAGHDPLQHWLSTGLAEGRVFPGIEVDLRGAGLSAEWQRFSWRGKPIHARVARPLPDAIVGEIVHQSSREPALLAIGRAAVPNVRRVDATSIYDRDGICVESLLGAAPRILDAVVVVDGLISRTGEQARGLCAALERTAAIVARILDVDVRREVRGLPSKPKPMSSHAQQVIHLGEHLRPGVELDETLLARTLLALRPATLLILDGAVQRRMLRQYGNALSSRSRIIFLPVDPLDPGRGLDADISPDVVIAVATQREEETLRSRFGHEGASTIVRIPRWIPPDRSRLEAQSATHANRVWRQPWRMFRRQRWLLLAASAADIEIFGRVAKAVPRDRHVIHVPWDLSGAVPFDMPRNVSIREGSVASALEGEVFTALLVADAIMAEDRASTWCEFGVPLILPQSRGLREIFDEDSVTFLCPSSPSEDPAIVLARAMNNVRGLSPTLRAARLRSAADDVDRYHSLESVAASLEAALRRAAR